MSRKEIACEYEGCTKCFCSSFNLNRHIESTHLGIRKYKCPVCSKELSSKQNFIDHQNIHTGARPYKCEVVGCGQDFRQLTQLFFHRQLHAEVKNQLNQLTQKNKMERNTTGNAIFKVEKTEAKVHQFKYLSTDPANSSYELPKISKGQYPITLPLMSTILKGEWSDS